MTFDILLLSSSKSLLNPEGEEIVEIRVREVRESSEHKHYFDNALTHKHFMHCKKQRNLERERSFALLYFTPFVFVKLIVETELLEWSGVEWSEAKSRNNCAL